MTDEYIKLFTYMLKNQFNFVESHVLKTEDENIKNNIIYPITVMLSNICKNNNVDIEKKYDTRLLVHHNILNLYNKPISPLYGGSFKKVKDDWAKLKRSGD